MLERVGLVARRRRRPSSRTTFPTDAPNPVVEAANDLWTVDFKGWWRTQDRKRRDPLTVRDAFSRYILEVRLVDDMTARTIRREFDRVFDRYGIPRAIQSDNGLPFASAMGFAGLTKLSAWWVSLGDELPGDAKQRRDAADEAEQRHAVVTGSDPVGTPDEPTQ